MQRANSKGTGAGSNFDMTAATNPALPGPPGMPQHEARALVLGELHARPFLPLTPPLRIYHLAFMTTDEEARADRSHIAALATAHGFAPPAPDAKYHRFDFGIWELRWEQHTEFTTYTWLTGHDAAVPFAHPDPLGSGEIAFTPHGKLIAAVHMSVIAPEKLAPHPVGSFDPLALCVIKASEDSARVTTDFKVDAAGFTRFLIESKDLTPSRAARLVQRMLELETYRTLALLGLPEARAAGPELQTMEKELGQITQAIATAPDTAAQQGLLTRLSKLAAAIEAQAAHTAFRFSASRAYYAQVKSRLELIQEQQEGDYVSITAFFRRRLEPAIDTCAAIEDRQRRLSAQLARASDMLRTGIQFELQHQNRDLLRSMDERASMQLRLQQTVEGLSVAAISYYVVGLIAYFTKGFKETGLLPKALTPEIVTAISVPLVVGTIYFAMRHVHRRLKHKEDSARDA
jgi:uncharacterized membrane-anchored protein